MPRLGPHSFRGTSRSSYPVPPLLRASYFDNFKHQSSKCDHQHCRANDQKCSTIQNINHFLFGQIYVPRSGWGAGTAPQTNKAPTAGTVGALNFYEVSPPQQTLLNETIPIDCTVNTRLPESGWPVCFPTGPLARTRFLRESWLATGHYAEGASASMIRQSATVFRLQESISASSSPASAVRSAILRLIASRCWLATTSTAMQD